MVGQAVEKSMHFHEPHSAPFDRGARDVAKTGVNSEPIFILAVKSVKIRFNYFCSFNISILYYGKILTIVVGQGVEKSMHYLVPFEAPFDRGARDDAKTSANGEPSLRFRPQNLKILSELLGLLYISILN